MQSIDLAQAHLRALTLLAVKEVAGENGVAPSAHDDVVRRITSGLTLDSSHRLVTRTGEGVRDFLQAKLDLMRSDPSEAYLFSGTGEPVPAPSTKYNKPLHKMTARQRLELVNGSDPFAGL